MPATSSAMYQQNGAASLATAFPQVVGFAQNLDLIQIVSSNGQGVLLNVSSTGVVHKPAVAATNGARVGVFQTVLTSTSTTAQLFANAFANPSNQDILQVINEGGNVSFYLDYLGVSHGS